VKGILKAELKRRHVGYKELAEKLHALGIKDSERNIANKIARGSFTAVFFVQCLTRLAVKRSDWMSLRVLVVRSIRRRSRTY
jgi:hypothetical protein